jgi:hypothetical protein
MIFFKSDHNFEKILIRKYCKIGLKAQLEIFFPPPIGNICTGCQGPGRNDKIVLNIPGIETD